MTIFVGDSDAVIVVFGPSAIVMQTLEPRHLRLLDGAIFQRSFTMLQRLNKSHQVRSEVLSVALIVLFPWKYIVLTDLED